MISSLSQKLSSIFSSLMASRRVTEENISEAIREVRLALLDADVNYHVVKEFIAKVKAKILGEETWKHVSPGQQFVKYLHEELVALLSGDHEDLCLQGSPSVLLLCGLQGAGKTTTCAKIAAYAMTKKNLKKVLVVPCDLKRFAAIEQLKGLVALVGADVYECDSQEPVAVARQAVEYAKKQQYDLVLIDTAGRLHVDDALMQELVELQRAAQATERLFVMNLAMGQDAVNTAKVFDQHLNLTGCVISMTDGDARAGAVLSVKSTVGKPIKLEGCGERIQDLRLFNASSMADRILGMGDVVHLVEKMRECVSEEDSKMEEKLAEASFTYEDFYKQMVGFRRLGPLRKLMGMMPSFGGMRPSDEELESSEKQMKQTEAIILSMTPDERKEKVSLDMSRMKRIAAGCGLSLGEVNQFRKQMLRSKKMLKGMTKEKMEAMSKKMFGGNQWH